MKKKYVLCLVVISIMFLFVLTMGTGYGVWLATNNVLKFIFQIIILLR